MAVLSNPTIASHAIEVRELETAARPLKLELHVLKAAAPAEFGHAFSLAVKKRAGALVALGGSVFFASRGQLVELAARHRLPAMYGAREYVEAGGLMAYAPDLRHSFRRAADYVDRIRKGAKPADLPVEQPTTFALVVNLKAAKRLELTMPPSLLAAADQIIE